MKVPHRDYSIFKTQPADGMTLIERVQKIEGKNNSFKITILIGISMKKCSNFKITNIAFNVYDGDKNVKFDKINLDYSNALNSTIGRRIQEEIKEIQAIHKSTHAIQTSVSDSFSSAKKQVAKSAKIKKEDTKNLNSKSATEKLSSSNIRDYYFEGFSIENETNTMVSFSTGIPLIQDALEKNIKAFCTELIRKEIDPATYRREFPLPDITKIGSGAASYKLRECEIFGEIGKYYKGKVYTEYFPYNLSFDVDLDKLKNLGAVTCEIISKSSEDIVSQQEFTLDLRWIAEEMNQEKSSIIDSCYVRKIVGENELGLSSYKSIAPPKMSKTNNPLRAPKRAEITSRFLNKNQNTMLRLLSGNKHVGSEFSFSSKDIEKIFASNSLYFKLKKIEDTLVFDFYKIPSDVVSIGLEKRNVTKNEKFRPLNIIVQVKGNNVTISDSDLKDDNVYEYRPYCKNKKGKLVTFSNIATHHYIKRNTSILISISNQVRGTAQTKNLQSYEAIGFEIEVDLTKGGQREKIEKLLKDNNSTLKDFGINDNNLEAIKKNLIFEISRQNLNTGETITFQPTSDRQFYDTTADPGSKSKLSPIQRESSYLYTVRVGIISPGSLSTSQVQKSIPNQYSKQYSSPSYKHSAGKKDGKLAVSRSQPDPFEDFRKKYSGIESYAEFSSNLRPPSVQYANAQKTYFGYNKISWRVDEVSKIDHFRIYAIADGIKSHIGSSHPHSQEEYFYEDSEMYGRLGEVKYFILPILLDYSEGVGLETNSIIKKNNFLPYSLES